MGAYEDRYPEAYGRGEDAAQPPAQKELKAAAAPRQVRDAPSTPRPRFGPHPVEQRDAEREHSAAWRHAPAATTGSRAYAVEPSAAVPLRAIGNHRGIGPRGYVRAPARIYEDICDRLTENPFIDASDIEVVVTAAEVLLRGSVDNMISLRQAEAIAHEAIGVSHVYNELALRSAAEPDAPAPGDHIDRAIGTSHR